MTTIPEKSAALIDRIIADVGLELPDRITCGWQEALDGLVREARAEERAACLTAQNEDSDNLGRVVRMWRGLKEEIEEAQSFCPTCEAIFTEHNSEQCTFLEFGAFIEALAERS